MSQFGVPVPAPAGPQSPLQVIPGALALLSFVYMAFVSIAMFLLRAANVDLGGLLYKIGFIQDVDWVWAGAIGLVAILFLIGGLLLITRKSSGRVVTPVACLGTLALIVALPISEHYFAAQSTFYYVVLVFALVLLVLCVLPATGKAIRGASSGYTPPQQQFMPPQFAAPYQQQPHQQQPYQQQPGYPQQQPPGGYQQPPGGSQR